MFRARDATVRPCDSLSGPAGLVRRDCGDGSNPERRQRTSPPPNAACLLPFPRSSAPKHADTASRDEEAKEPLGCCDET
ncbi:hypothetical protein MBELCI_0438 [Limimaricola cinnabarinus LL-001]|uniref:Uncharacterized protein n=1 Tax=Limimaricola cinnabarinus LL-001 TaxID=1337093 RepID=U2YI83_9RHOB|nr:hypothetical protein MBELCI_0438 [Limimaricola cinnabarinus LL-001]